MMKYEPRQHYTVGIPGKSYSFRMGTPPADDAKVNRTVSTGTPDFEQIEHLLSEKPLRRPNRTHPIVHSGIWDED